MKRGLTTQAVDALQGPSQPRQPAKKAKPSPRTRAAKTTVLRPQSERQFQAQVAQALTLRGWDVLVIPDSRRVGMRGWPDVVALHPTRRVLIAWECKGARTRIRPEQVDVLARLAAVERIDIRVVRPADWPEVRRILGVEALT